MNIFLLFEKYRELTETESVVRAAEPGSEVRIYTVSNQLTGDAEKTKCDVLLLDAHYTLQDPMEVAKRVQAINPKVNVIFAGTNGDLCMDAFEMLASGFIRKPVTQEVLTKQFANLRYPVIRGARARTFGSFELLVNGKPVTFSRGRCKEMLAYLIDRRGAAITRRELAAVLFGDDEFTRSSQNYLSMISHDLIQDLEKVGVGGLFVKEDYTYKVDTAKFTCDVYELLDGEEEIKKHFFGEYMSQYPWAGLLYHPGAPDLKLRRVEY